MAAKKMGRPKMANGEAKAEVLTLRLTKDERKAVEAAAKRAGLPVSEWARQTIVRGSTG